MFGIFPALRALSRDADRAGHAARVTNIRTELRRSERLVQLSIEVEYESDASDERRAEGPSGALRDADGLASSP